MSGKEGPATKKGMLHICMNTLIRHTFGATPSPDFGGRWPNKVRSDEGCYNNNEQQPLLLLGFQNDLFIANHFYEL